MNSWLRCLTFFDALIQVSRRREPKRALKITTTVFVVRKYANLNLNLGDSAQLLRIADTMKNMRRRMNPAKTAGVRDLFK